VLDVYRRRLARTSKDTNGGYGTVNDYGDGTISRLLTRLKAKSVDWPPLYSVYAAAVLQSNGHSVTFLRGSLDEIDPTTLSDCDLFLCTSSIVCHETEVRAIRMLRPHAPVGVMGPFATSLPQPYVAAGAFVIAGEPELFLMSHPSLEDLVRSSGVVASSPTGITSPSSPKAGLRIDGQLEKLPLPAWDAVIGTSKPRYGLLGGGELFLPLIATRGCPYSCSYYCTYPLQQGKTVRLRAPAALVQEMGHWQDRLGASLFMFRDPVFSLNRKHTLQFCDELIASGRNIKFIVETHLNNMDPELAQRLRQAGLVMVKTGIESANSEVMKSAGRFTIEQDKQLERIRFLESLGVKVTCFYIFGLPQDTEETCMQTVEYAKRINSFGAQFSVFTPYPGTPVFKDYEDRVALDRYEDFTQWNLVFEHEHISAPRMRSILGTAYRDYYTNPKWIAKYLGYKLRSLLGR
jgi:radical SAM superfamily enzyme YgiQ (UPF0313 family)